MEVRHQVAIPFGDRAALRISGVFGCWPFIIGLTVFLLAWIALNLVTFFEHWDPYPFILLNLVLSFLSAYMGPILLIASNVRDKIADRRDQENDRRMLHLMETILAISNAQTVLLEKLLGESDG